MRSLRIVPPFDCRAKRLLKIFRKSQRMLPGMICINALNRDSDVGDKFVTAIGTFALIDLGMRHVSQLFE